MNDADRSRRRKRAAAVFLVFAVGAFLGTKTIAHVYSDFSVSYFAARELLLGTGTIYRGYEGHEEAFGYPHAALLPLLPLVAWLPREAVVVAFGISQGLATVLLFRELARIVVPVTWPRALLTLVLFGRCLDNAYRNGQPALWCGVLVTLGVRQLLERKDGRSGLALAAATTLKLTPGIFVLALPALRRPRAAAALVVALAVICLVLPWPVLGTTRHVGALHDFAYAMLAPLLGTAQGSDVIWNARGLHVAGAFGLGLPRAVRWAWSAALLGLAGVAWARAGRLEERERTLRRVCATLLVMVLLSPLTRAHHLLLASAALVYWAARGPGRGLARAAWIAGVTLFLLAFPLRQRALLGQTLWQELEYPCGHLGLVCVLVWLAAERAAARTEVPAALR